MGRPRCGKRRRTLNTCLFFVRELSSLCLCGCMPRFPRSRYRSQPWGNFPRCAPGHMSERSRRISESVSFCSLLAAFSLSHFDQGKRTDILPNLEWQVLLELWERSWQLITFWRNWPSRFLFLFSLFTLSEHSFILPYPESKGRRSSLDLRCP